MEKPIKNSYWVIPGKLLAGEYPRNKDEASSRAKIKALLDAGITNFIDLTEETEGLLPYSLLICDDAVHERFAVKDVSIPLSKELTRTILDAIDRHLAQGRKVYVHCWGGVGRTGMIIGCWLARNGAGSGAEALQRLRANWKACEKSAWRETPETSAQERYIIDWSESEKGDLIGFSKENNDDMV